MLHLFLTELLKKGCDSIEKVECITKSRLSNTLKGAGARNDGSALKETNGESAVPVSRHIIPVDSTIRKRTTCGKKILLTMTSHWPNIHLLYIIEEL